MAFLGRLHPGADPVRRRDLVAGGLSLALGGTIAGCNRSPDRAQSGAQRLVVIGAALTEIVFAVGQGSLVVGADSSSTHPEEAKSRASLGYHRKLSTEGILSLAPSFVIATSDAGPPETFTQLADASVRVERVEVPTTWQAAVERIRKVASLVDRAEEGARVARETEEGVRRVQAFVQSHPSRPRALYVFAPSANATMVAGRETPADLILSLAGATNAAAELSGFQPWTPEASAAIRPEVIVVSDAGLAKLGGMQPLLDRPGIRDTPAALARRVILVDDTLVLGLGPRLADAASDLARALHKS